MANQPAKQVDVLGFDRMEIANVRRSYGANKVNYSKLSKLYEKAAALKGQIDSLLEQIKVWDAPARALALEKVGVELSSEEILLAHTEPEKFFEMYPNLRPEKESEETDEAEIMDTEKEKESEGPEM